MAKTIRLSEEAEDQIREIQKQFNDCNTDNKAIDRAIMNYLKLYKMNIENKNQIGLLETKITVIKRKISNYMNSFFELDGIIKNKD
jgi:hypothetical protein